MKKLLVLILGIILGILISNYIINPHTDTETMTKPPRGVISPETAKQMDQAFNTRHKLISDSILGKPDNRSAWWSLDDLKAYIGYAEGQAKELGYKMDGIRVYLAAHPDELNDGYTTVFIAPTGKRVLAEGSLIDAGNQKGGEGSGDIPGGDPLNNGSTGIPPSNNYPQGNNN